MSVTRAWLAAVAVGAVTSPLAAGSAPAEGTIAVARSHGGTLVFTSDADGDTDVYAVPVRGDHVRRLSRNYDADEAVSLGATVARRWRGAVFILRRDGRWRRVGKASPYVDGSPGVYDRGRRVAFIRGEALIVATVSGRQLRRVRLRGPPDVAPDGRHVVFTTSAGDSATPGVVLTNVATGKSRRLARGSGFETTWSLDGSLLLLRREVDDRPDEYRLADLSSARRPRLLARGELGGHSWSTDGRWLAFARSVQGGSVIKVVNTRSGRRWATSIRGYLGNLSWSPRGPRFAVESSSRGQERLIVVNVAARVVRTVSRARDVSLPKWAPDGRRIAFVERRTDVEAALAIAPGSGARARTLVRAQNIWPVDWHPGARRIVYATNRVIGVVDVKGRVRGTSRATFYPPSELVWSPRRNAAAFTAGYGGESVYVFRGDGKRLVRLTRRGHDRILAWLPSSPPRRAVRARPIPSTEQSAARTLDTRGPVVAVSAYGRAAGVLVAPHELDCIHPVVWRPGSRVIRVGTAAPCSPDSETVPLDVELTAGSISWKTYFCGNNCYTNTYRAPWAATDLVVVLGESGTEDAPEPPLPPSETHRRVSILVSGGVVRLRRLADGAERTIDRPGARIFDAELEDEGLFYAFNRPRGAFRGRVVFVPFDELFAGAP